MNQLTIAGHLGADPEVRFTSSGQKVTTLRVAARTRRKGNSDDTIWWRVTVWGEQFDKMIAFFKKGSSIIVLGELSKPEIFTDRDGNPQVSMNITAHQLLFSPFGRTDGGASATTADTQLAKEEEVNAGVGSQMQQGQGGHQQQHSSSFNDDEIPF